MNEALEALEVVAEGLRCSMYERDNHMYDEEINILKSALEQKTNTISSKYSKPFNVRVFRDTQLDIIQEFNTFEEAEIFCKQWENNYCLISKAIDEKVPEHWKNLK